MKQKALEKKNVSNNVSQLIRMIEPNLTNESGDIHISLLASIPHEKAVFLEKSYVSGHITIPIDEHS